jgi:hypothetical protein
MLFKEIKSLEEARQYFSVIENEDSGFKIPFNQTGFAGRGLSANIIEYPKTPINNIFNRVVFNSPTSAYFSISLEPIRKLSAKSFKNREIFIEDIFEDNCIQKAIMKYDRLTTEEIKLNSYFLRKHIRENHSMAGFSSNLKSILA